MMVAEPLKADEEGAIDFVALWNVLWAGKFLISAITLIFGIGAVVLALTATPKFRAEVVITEVRDNNMGGASSLMNQLGGLASLAGVSLAPSSGMGREAQAVLKSRKLVETFIERNKLLPVLFENSTRPPTLWRGVLKFREGVIEIRDDRRNGTTTLAIEWQDPKIAAAWANGLVSLANEMIRERALADASRNIEFLNKQMAQTNVLEVQRVMYNLIESETKTLMLANARAEYAFTVVDPAVPPEFRISPRRTVMVLFGLALGGIVGVTLAWVLSRTGRARHTAARVS